MSEANITTLLWVLELHFSSGDHVSLKHMVFLLRGISVSFDFSAVPIRL